MKQNILIDEIKKERLFIDEQSLRVSAQPKVIVLNMRGNILSPTKPAKARHLLKKKKAVVVNIKPFVIQLTVATGENK